MKFNLGHVVITRGALTFVELHNIDVFALIEQHHNGEWGDLGAHDKALNEAAILNGRRVFSAYETQNERIWIITDATDDQGVRTATTIMLPSCY